MHLKVLMAYKAFERYYEPLNGLTMHLMSYEPLNGLTRLTEFHRSAWFSPSRCHAGKSVPHCHHCICEPTACTRPSRLHCKRATRASVCSSSLHLAAHLMKMGPVIKAVFVFGNLYPGVMLIHICSMYCTA